MLDLTATEVGTAPQEKVSYVWRVSSVACRKSNDNDNLRLDMKATIVGGPSAGFEARFPILMLYDSTGQGRTGQWIGRAKVTLGKILGDPSLVTDLPSSEGEVTPMMKELINAFFEAPAVFVGEQTNKSTGQVYDARWEVGRVIGPADPSAVVETDWSAYFN